jgi:hypothetical protein
MLVSLLGGATSGFWFYRIWWWTNLSLIDRRMALGLSGMYAGAWPINASGAVEQHALARLKPSLPKSCIRSRPFIGYHRITLEIAEGWDRTECPPRP